MPSFTERAAGERLFVDYAGHTIDVIDPTTGEVRTAQLFVATHMLGAEVTAQQIELMFAGGRALAQTEQAVGELLAIVGQHHANADRAGPFQVAQEPEEIGGGLGFVDADEDPAGRPPRLRLTAASAPLRTSSSMTKAGRCVGSSLKRAIGCQSARCCCRFRFWVTQILALAAFRSG